MRGFVIVRSLSISIGVLLSVFADCSSQTTVRGNLLLTGEWRVASQSVSPLIITKICKPILTGTTFKFKDDALEVYIDSSQKPCNVYHYKITENTISFIEEDMIWLCTYELNYNYLKLKSYNFFVPDKPNNFTSAEKQTDAAQEVAVILIKKIIKIDSR